MTSEAIGGTPLVVYVDQHRKVEGGAALPVYITNLSGGGGASDVDDLATATGSSGEMVRVAATGGLEYRTPAEVLGDIGAATAQAITAGSVVSRDGKKVAYNTQGVITAVAAMDYGDLVRSTQPWALLGYWPLNETSGVVATNNALSGSGFNSAYQGPTLNSIAGPAGLGNAPLFDGSNDYVNADSASMDAAFSFDEFTIIAWFKVAAIGDWTDGTFKKVWELVSSSGEEMSFDFSNANNTIRQRNLIGGSSFAVTYLVPSPTTNWYFAAVRHSLSQSFRDAWLNNVRIGTTATVVAATGTSIGTWRFGDYRTGGNPWHGYLAHCAVWRGALTTAELLALSKATLFT